MEKILKTFFDNAQVEISKNIRFEDTDLYDYLLKFYGAAPIFSENGFIKVVETKDSYILSENIFYDNYPSEDCRFISIEGLQINSSLIQNCDIGLNLSRNGFAIVPVKNEALLASLKMMSSLKYTEAEHIVSNEPFGTIKFNDEIWKKAIFTPSQILEKIFYDGILDAFNQTISFSDILKSLDIFDLNILEWRRGLSMDAHNGVDYKSFVNMISYNTEKCSKSRTLKMGHFEWEEITKEAIKSSNYENLMSIDSSNVVLAEHEVETMSFVLVNSFNPRFFHQVSEFNSDGSLYVCTANKSFKSITEKFHFKW
ncbi:hypothetical protein [Halobacteriovorax sp. HLS]|uniref:hypothetical protein n=1 Tax=Halobacteriovorax sp. HLS TaxID=2234000 RepID=UPI000FDC84A7|nr:hypothetical protein [Halobacteriovorax sp. HLS]